MNSDSLQRVSDKLAALTGLYDRLKVARAQLKLAGDDSSDLESRVQILQMQCGKALDELQAEYAKIKLSDSAFGPGAPSPFVRP